MNFLIAISLAAIASAGVVESRNDYQKYKCMTQKKWIDTNVQCAKQCELKALAPADGCKENDFYCHCQRTKRIDDIIAPCMLGDGTAEHPPACSMQDLGNFQESVTALCKYYNATVYAPYATCPWLLM